MSFPTHTLGAVQIPRGLVWEDELSWSAVETAADYGLTGSLIIDAAVKQNGRPITLVGSNDAGWITRTQLQALHALAAVPLATYTLTLADERVFTVRFAPGAQPIDARTIARPELPPEAYPYVATVRLVTA